jgi:Asp-tRNA(Asn)/Glu-tRNA(Gln) amidotransferase A subunit family amidase
MINRRELGQFAGMTLAAVTLGACTSPPASVRKSMAWSNSGLPIGVQIIGPYLEDRTTITFAELLELEFGGFTPPPGYAG